MSKSKKVSARKPGSPRFVISLLAIALAAWGTILLLQLRQSPAQSHIEAGNVFAGRGDGPNAIREWELATHVDPHNAFAWQLVGQSYYEAQQWRKAKEAFLQVQRLRPETPRIEALLSSCCQHLGESAEALTLSQKALARNPDDVTALNVYAKEQARAGNTQENIRCLRRLTELEPTQIKHLMALADVLIGQNDVTDTLPVVDRILQLDPNNADMCALRGIARFYADGTTEGMARSEADFAHALSLRPNIYACHLYLGRIAKRRGQWAQAAEHLQEATRLNPYKADAYYDLAATYDRVGQPDKAEATRQRFQEIVHSAERYVHLKKQCDVAQGDFTLNLQVGRMAIERKDLPVAHHYLEIALRLRPSDPEVQAAVQQLASLSPELPIPTLSAAANVESISPPSHSGGR